MNRPTCETCPFWDRHVNENKGFCRRMPPTRQSSETAIPQTYATEWCGEHPQFADFKFQWRQAEIAKLDEAEKARTRPPETHAH